jgi:hypothetical protein
MSNPDAPLIVLASLGSVALALLWLLAFRSKSR